MDKLNILNYKIIGNGYPVVFLHGFLESLEMWNYFNFENNFTCILIDLPGHGNSKFENDSASSMSAMANEVSRIIDLLGIKEFGIVGHSMGGYVGLELLSQDLRAEKMVLLNSNFWDDSDLKKQDRLRVAEIVKKNKNLFLYEAIPNLFSHPEKFNSDVKKLIEDAKKMNAKAISASSIAMSKRKNFKSFLAKIESQLLIIQGESDTIVPYSKMKQELHQFPNISLKVIVGGHMAHIENTLDTQGIIEEFLK